MDKNNTSHDCYDCGRFTGKYCEVSKECMTRSEIKLDGQRGPLLWISKKEK